MPRTKEELTIAIKEAANMSYEDKQYLLEELERAAGGTKKEFTAQDMKEAFVAGMRLHSGPPQWAWQRWMRNAYPERYARKPRPANGAKARVKA